MSFRDIKGQDKPINILKVHIEQSRLQGAHLFIGPQGLGKKLVAKTLAKALNCLEGGFDSCDRCAPCRKIDNGQHPDVHIIDCGDSEIKIEHVRQLQREANLKPYEGKVKVFVIDNAHKLTAEASNATLKILEEPPADSLIILISDKPVLLFKTITSRCKILKFSPLKRGELKEVLRKDHGLDNNMAHFLAYFSEGRLGAALRLKDTGILNEKNMVIDKLLFSGKPSSDNLPVQNRKEVRNYLNTLVTWFRDIYLIKIGMPHSEIINFDRKDELLKLMGRLSFSELNEALDTISDSIFYLERNVNTKLLLYNLGVQLHTMKTGGA